MISRGSLHVKAFFYAILSILLFQISGCISFGSLPNDEKVEIEEGESIVVIGLQEGGEAVFHAGSYESELFSYDGFLPKGFYQKDGTSYIVQKGEISKENRAYGMIYYENDLGRFSFACNQEVPLLKVKGSGVEYFGEFNLTVENGEKLLRHSYDMDKAQRYVDETYPLSDWKLVEGEIVKSKAKKCTPGGVIVIFI